MQKNEACMIDPPSAVTHFLPLMIQVFLTSSHIDLAPFYVGGGGGNWSGFLQLPLQLGTR